MPISLPEPLGSLLNGIESSAITNFYGGPGTGKTNVCLLASIDALKSNCGTVVYIDSEGGFSLERLKQLTPDWNSALKNIELLEPKTFSEQGKAIRELEKKSPSLVIVDSVVALYRLEYSGEEVKKKSNEIVIEANRELSKQLSILSNISRDKKIPVIVTAHTFKNWDNGGNEIIGGEVLKYWSKAIVFLEKTGKMSERKATLVKHRHMPEGKSVKFMLVEDGIKPAGFKLF